MITNQNLIVPRYCKIPIIPGDGIGPEVWRATKKVLNHLIKKVYSDQKGIEWIMCLAGQEAYDKTGHYLPAKTLDRVLFPDPLGPIIACISPSFIFKEKLSKIFLSSIDTERFLIDRSIYYPTLPSRDIETNF